MPLGHAVCARVVKHSNDGSGDGHRGAADNRWRRHRRRGARTHAHKHTNAELGSRSRWSAQLDAIQVAKTFLTVLQKQGITFKLQSKVTKVSKTGSGASVTVRVGNNPAVPRRPPVPFAQTKPPLCGSCGASSGSRV